MPFNFGSFAGGLAGGMARGQEMALQAQEHKLKAKMLEHQIKKSEFEQQQREQAQREADQQALDLGSAVDMITKGVKVPGGGTPGYESPEQNMSVAEVPAYRPATQEEKFGALIKGTPRAHQYNVIQQYMKGQGGGTAGSVSRAFPDYESAIAFKNSPGFNDGFPMGAKLTQTSKGWQWTGIMPYDPVSNTYHATLNAPGGTREGAQAAANQATYEKNVKAGEGSKQGALNVEATPQFQQNITNKERAKAEGQPVPEGQLNKIESNAKVADSLKVIRDNFDPSFLGPLRGTDTAFEVRRQAGSKIKSPLTDREVKFRTELNNLKNTALYDASGAQINEQEQKRIANVLPKATDEPAVFEAGLQRYEAEVQRLGLRRKEDIGKSRGDLRQPGATPAAPAAPQPQGRKPITAAQAKQFLDQAGGNAAKARQMAIDAGFDPTKVTR